MRLCFLFSKLVVRRRRIEEGEGGSVSQSHKTNGDETATKGGTAA